jgi:hypothetical protein
MSILDTPRETRTRAKFLSESFLPSTYDSPTEYVPSGNRVPDTVLPQQFDNGILQQGGINSGLELYAVSDAFNAQTVTQQDEKLKPVGGNISGVIESGADFSVRQTLNNKLMALRAMNPFLQIAQLPNAARTVVLAANVAKDIPIPAGAKYVKFRGNLDWYLNANGTAAVPTVDVLDGSASIYRPEDVFFYIEEMQCVSVVAPATTIVSAYFYYQM